MDGRERVLREARRLFAARGYAEVSMREIADGAGVTKPAIYYHFRDKDDLFAEVFRRENERLLTGVAERLAAGGTLRDQLTGVARFLLDTGRAAFDRLFTDFLEHAPPEQRRTILDRPPPPHEALRPAFARAIAAGEIRAVDPDLAVALFLGAVLSQIHLARVGGPTQPPADLAATIVDLVFRGIGLPAPSIERAPN